MNSCDIIFEEAAKIDRTANEIVTEYTIQFVKDHWEEITNYKHFETLGISNKLSEFIKEVESDINTAGWVSTETMTWVLSYNYYKDLIVYEFDDDSEWFTVLKINDNYIKWKYTNNTYIFEFAELKTKTITYFE